MSQIVESCHSPSRRCASFSRRHCRRRDVRAAGGAGPAARRRRQGSRHRDLRSCHGLNMITGSAGYTQDGWRDLIAHDGPAASAAQAANGVAVPRRALPAEAGPRAGARARRRVGDVQGMDRSDARPALARSAADQGRHDLVERAVHQPRRAAQSEHRRDARVQTRREPRVRTASSTMRRATSGTWATATGRSASSFRRPGRSPRSRCPIRRLAIRTRGSSTRTGRCSSRCSRAT